MSSLSAIEMAEKLVAKAKKKEAENTFIFHPEPLEPRNTNTFMDEDLSHFKQPEESLPDSCPTCQGARIQLQEGARGTLAAGLCSCMDRAGWDLRKKFEKWTENLAAAEIPNRYLGAESTANIRQEITDFAETIFGKTDKKNLFLFLYGGVGTGKTHSAIHVMIKYLYNTEDKSCFYIPVHQYQELSRNRNAYDFDHKAQRAQTQHEFIWVKKRCETADLLVLDELGQDPLSQEQQKSIFALLDARYASNKPTILISNHCDNKNLSLEGKLLSTLVGPRIASRIKSAKQVHCNGDDYRVTKEHCEVVTQEEAERFKMDGKILTHSDDEHQIMTWLTRNPAFETVSTQRRKELTYLNSDGAEADLDRAIPSYHKDVWINGDSLTVSGPVCDHEDKKLYALLLKELAKSHKDGNSGLVLEISINEILRKINQQNSGQNHEKIKRQLGRLTRMSMDFKSAKGDRWIGPLINDIILSKPSLKESKVRIEFNRFMIAFYRLHAYTTFDLNTSKNLKGDSNAFYIFYLSHSMREMSVSIDRCKKLLGIDQSFDKKEARKRIKTAVDNLITAKVMDPARTYIKDGKVYTNLAAELR